MAQGSKHKAVSPYTDKKSQLKMNTKQETLKPDVRRAEYVKTCQNVHKNDPLNGEITTNAVLT